MNNTTKIFRTEKKKGYHKISKIISDLPFLESSIMFKILSNSDDYIINKSVIEKQTGIGRRKFNLVWNNLIKKGHIKQKKKTDSYNKKHKIISWEYIIFENPSDNLEYNQNGSIQKKIEYDQNGSIQRGVESYRFEHVQNGIINNNQLNNNNLEPGGVDPRNGVEGDPQNTGPSILGKIEDSPTIEDFNIFNNVPHSSLRSGVVRDIDRNQIEEPKTIIPTQELKQGPRGEISILGHFQDAEDITSMEDFKSVPEGVISNNVHKGPNDSIPTQELKQGPRGEISILGHFQDAEDITPTEGLKNSPEGVISNQVPKKRTINDERPEFQIFYFNNLQKYRTQMLKNFNEDQLSKFVKLSTEEQNDYLRKYIKKIFKSGIFINELDEGQDYSTDPETIKLFKDTVHDLLYEKFPNYKSLIKKNPCHKFLEIVKNQHKGDKEVIGLLSEVHYFINHNI